MEKPFVERRAALEAALASVQPPVHLTPATTSIEEARDWFTRFEGAGLDGVVAKPAGIAYLPDKRVMFKVKHHRTADCAVAGFRWHKDGKGVGSMLLGLFDDDGTLHHVGVCASFTAKFRGELAAELEPLRKDALVAHPWQGWAEMSGEGRDAGRGEPVERPEGPVMGTHTRRARDRGRVRSAPVAAVPPGRSLPALASRPHPRVVHVRPTRRRRPPRARETVFSPQ